MDLNHLKEFIIVADTRNLSDSAQRLFMSESALSKHISLLENQLETKLFLRGKRGVTLTESGAVFYEDAKRIASECDRALLRLSSIEKRNVVRIGYLRNASASFIANFMMRVDEEYPNVYPMFTAMEYGEIEEAMATKRIDMAFTMNLPGTHDGCDVCMPLYHDRLYLIAAQNHPLASANEGIASHQLAEADVLMPDKRTYPDNAYRFYESLLPETFEGKVRRYRDVDTLYSVVSNGKYVGFSSGHNKTIAPENVRFIPLLDRNTEYDVCALFSSTPATPAVDLYAEVLQDLKDTGVISAPRA